MLLAEAGYAVAMVGRTASKLDDSEAMIREELADVVEGEVTLLKIAADVSAVSACDAVVAETVETLGGIHALANVAGDAPLQPIDRVEEEVFDACIANNLKSVVFLTKAAWPHFKKQRSGAICSVSSMAAFDPFKGFNIYAAAKAGVGLFMKAAADEGKRLNVTASSVAPGAIETPMLRQNFSEKAIPEANALDPLIIAGVIRDLLTGRREHAPGECIQIPSPH